MLDSGEGTSWAHRKLALDHLYRALWGYPAHGTSSASANTRHVPVHHRSILVNPLPLSLLLSITSRPPLQGAGKQLLKAVEGEMERLCTSLVDLIVLCVSSLYVPLYPLS